MDGLERRYKVRLRKKYEADLGIVANDVNEYSKSLAILLGCTAIALVIGLSPALAIVGVGPQVYRNVRSLVNSITEKTVLQTRIEDIEAELGMQDDNANRESAGRKR